MYHRRVTPPPLPGNKPVVHRRLAFLAGRAGNDPCAAIIARLQSRYQHVLRGKLQQGTLQVFLRRWTWHKGLTETDRKPGNVSQLQFFMRPQKISKDYRPT